MFGSSSASIWKLLCLQSKIMRETMGFEHVNDKDEQKDEVGNQADKVTNDGKSQVRENDVNVDIPKQQASSNLREGEDATADDSVEHKVSDEQTSSAATDDSSCKKEEQTVADDFQNKFKPEESMGFKHVNDKDEQKDEVGNQADKVTNDGKSQVRENDVNVDIPEQQASSNLREGEDATADDSVEHKVSDEQTSNAATDDSSCKKEEPTMADDFQNKFKPEVHEVEGFEAAKSSMTPLNKCDPRKSYSAVVRNKVVELSSSTEQKV